MTKSFRKKAQSLLEYSILLGIIGVALTGMFTYMKRGLQATVKVSCDQLGHQQITVDSSKQLTSVTTKAEARSGSLRTVVFTGGAQSRNLDSTDVTTGSGRTRATQKY
jgi:uncharacterized protein (UPF0333 family)